MAVSICLIENTERQGLVVQQMTLQVLSEFTQPVVAVAITGLYCTGRSYLMNRLARERPGERGGEPHRSQLWIAKMPGFSCSLSNTVEPLASSPPVSPWASPCSFTPKVSGCGVCLTPAGLDTLWCCWTLKGGVMWRRCGRSRDFLLCLQSTLWKLSRAQPCGRT